jgi:two-component system nitrate/nitrite response regulator NarL
MNGYDANQAVVRRNQIRIAVIDDHPMFREGMVQMLKRADGFNIVGAGATAADALKVAQELAPDVILLDLCMPGGGIEAAACIARDCPNVRIIVLTASENEQDVTLALQAGARGYILKSSSGPEVVETVHAVVRGDLYVAPNLAARLLIKKCKRIETVVNDNLR